MIDLLNKSFKPKVIPAYDNFINPYNIMLASIELMDLELYVRSDHIFNQLLKRVIDSDNFSYYYRGSVKNIEDFLRIRSYPTFTTMGNINHESILFTDDVNEVVIAHSEFPDTKYLTIDTDPSIYEPIRFVYHPYSNLEYGYLDGNYNPDPDIADPYVFYLINIPHLVLQYKSYLKLMASFNETPNRRAFISKYILIPLFKQYANISLYNRYQDINNGKKLPKYKPDKRFGYTFYNGALLDRAMKRAYRNIPKTSFDNVISNVPTLTNSIDFYMTHTTSESLINRPFRDLAKIEILINTFRSIIPSEELSAIAKLDVYLKRMIKGREYAKFLTGLHYNYFEYRIDTLLKLINRR